MPHETGKADRSTANTEPPQSVATPAGGRREWFLAVVILAVVALMGGVVERTLGDGPVPLVYLLGVVVSPLFLSRWPVTMLAFGGVTAWGFFYLPKPFPLRLHRTEDAVMLGVFLVAALVSGHLASRPRSRERGSLEGERTARTLYDLLRGLNESRDMEDGGLDSAVAKVERVFQARVALLRQPPGRRGLMPQGTHGLTLSERGAAAATRAREIRQWTGRATAEFPDVAATCVPLLSGGKVWGVLAVQLAPGKTWSAIERELMESVAGLLAEMLEREETTRQARAAQVVLESQKMQSALVDNFSHEMQTPLSVLASALQHLRQQGGSPSDPEVLHEASIAVSRLSLVVSEMVDLAQLDSGVLRPALEWGDAADVLREWLESRADAGSGHDIRLSLPSQSVYIRLDARLLDTSLNNILDNALRHAPAGTPIEVDARVADGRLLIEIADHGPGIAAGDEQRVFERFYRGPSEAPGGMGLGLAVAKEFIESMGGTIAAASNPGGGACFTIDLPCATQLPAAKEASA